MIRTVVVIVIAAFVIIVVFVVIVVVVVAVAVVAVPLLSALINPYSSAPSIPPDPIGCLEAWRLG